MKRDGCSRGQAKETLLRGSRSALVTSYKAPQESDRSDSYFTSASFVLQDQLSSLNALIHHADVTLRLAAFVSCRGLTSTGHALPVLPVLSSECTAISPLIFMQADADRGMAQKHPTFFDNRLLKALSSASICR